MAILDSEPNDYLYMCAKEDFLWTTQFRGISIPTTYRTPCATATHLTATTSTDRNRETRPSEQEVGITAILFLAVAPGAVAQGDFSLDLDFAPSAPETIRPPEGFRTPSPLTAPAYMNRDWMHLLRHRVLNVKDTTVVWPNRFVDFVIGAYNWVDHTFNSFDPGYVCRTQNRGKVRIVCTTTGAICRIFNPSTRCAWW